MSLQNVKFLCKLGLLDKVEKLLRNFIDKFSAGEMTIDSKKNLKDFCMHTASQLSLVLVLLIFFSIGLKV